MRAPIAIMSFNRPGYLAKTLASLKAQTPESLHGREIHLFQDGAVNLYSKIRYAAQADINRSMAIFREHFPQGQVHFWEHNVGICENFCRAESHLFQERGFEFAYFFEDDMVLSPVYLEMMELLQRFAERSPRVAYFSAHGDYGAQPEEIAQRRRELINLDQHWGFGLRRRAWARVHEFLAPYYKIIEGTDYSRRDHVAVFQLFSESGAVPRGSSQDAAKAWACDQLGLWRCSTVAPFGRYIGSKGAHMTQEAYDAAGFGRTIVQAAVIEDLVFPDDSGIDAKLAEQRASFVAVKRDELSHILALLPRELNPMRRCTADEVRMAYRLLLHRDPESQEVIDHHARHTAVYTFVRGVIESKEFREFRERLDRA